MRIRAIIKRIFKQILRDKRTLALLMVAPLFVLTLMYFIFDSQTVMPTLGVLDLNEDLIQLLKEEEIHIKEVNDYSKACILSNDLDGILKTEENNSFLMLENGDTSVTKSLQMKVSKVLIEYAKSQLPKQALMQMQEPSIEMTYVYGSEETTFFDTLNPVLINFFVFFFVFLISGIGLLRERMTGTLERLMSTPIKRYEVVCGYLVGYGVFAIIQTLVIVFYSIEVLNIVLVGSIGYVILINLITALVALALGILLSTFAASEFQMIQFIPIVIVPQVFFAGIFPLEGMAKWLQGVAKIMPLSYSANALKGVMYKGWGFEDIKSSLLALSVFGMVFIILNSVALRKYRKH